MFLNLQQISDRYGLPLRTLNAMRRAGELNVLKMGPFKQSRCLVELENLADALSKHRETHNKEPKG